MELLPNLIIEITSAGICAALILFRCAYRVFFPCRVHASCHRRWRTDDTFMTFALFPLVVRTVTIVLCFSLNPDQAATPATDQEAAALGTSVEQLDHDRALSRKLLIPSRLSYALFLWSLKLSLLAFYTRFVGPLDWGRAAIKTLWVVIVCSYIAVLLATLVECRPLRLAWELAPKDERSSCARGMGNLLTMASFNIVTDIALIILPFPMLRHVRLNFQKKIQLTVLFGIGAIVVVITITRIPLILIHSVSQRSRTMWASIEIICACVVTNGAFYYKIARDLRYRTHDHVSNNQQSGAMYLQSIPSSTACLETPEPTKSHPPDTSTVEDVAHKGTQSHVNSYG